MRRLNLEIPTVIETLIKSLVSLIVFLLGFWVGVQNPSARLDAYQRCVSLMDHGAQWDESEGGWRCKVVQGAER